MIYLISRYEITREYGGPEEGGWWWDCVQFAGVVATCADRAQAEKAAQNLTEGARKEAEEKSQGHRPVGRFSVNGGSDEWYAVETTAGEHEEVEAPFWC